MILTTAPAGRGPRGPLGISMTSQARLNVSGSLALIFFMATSFFRSTRANQPSPKQRRWPAERANHTCENLTLDSLSGAAKLSDLWRIFGSLDFCVLWLAEMPSAESGAILSRPSANFEPALEQEFLSILRTRP